MSLEATLGIARTGLLYTQRSLATAANNVANAETEGYTRKTVSGQSIEAGGYGLGVRTLAATRDVDDALVAELDARRGALAAADMRETILKGIEAAHGQSETGESIGDLVASLRSAFTALRGDPSSQGQQMQVVVAAQNLAGRLNTVSNAIGAARQKAQDGIVSEVASMNATLNSIADLTDQIRSNIALGLSAADLEDKRDTAIAKLSESIGLTTLKKEDGSLTLIARGGMALPLDKTKPAFSTSDATLGSAAYYGLGGSIPGVMLGGVDVTNQVAGGRLAELISLRDATLPRMQAETDVAAAGIAWRFESEGLRLFTDTSGTVPDATQPYVGSAQIGFAGTIRVNSAVEANMMLLRDGTHAVVAAPGGPTAFTPNAIGGPAGFTTMLDRVLDFTFGTEAAAGATWPGFPNTGLGPDGTLGGSFTAPSTIEGYGAAVTASHTAARAMATERKASAEAMKTGLETRFAQRSGVDVDAEMAAMVTLQNAYAANAKVMSTVQQMWDALLGAVR